MTEKKHFSLLSLPMVLSDCVDEVAIGAILKHRRTGELAVYVDYDDEHGFQVAKTAVPINTEDWILLTQPDERKWEELNGWVHEAKR